MPAIPRLSILLTSLLTGAVVTADAAVLAPDDPAVAGNLQLWLTNAAGTYDTGSGTWADSSGKGRDAVTVGEVNVNAPVTYGSPSLVTGVSTIDRNGSALLFSGAADDLMRSTGLNGGVGFTDLTIFSVYNLTSLAGTSNLTRPAGVGSVAGTQANPGNHFNLASDPSVRKDNGQIGSGAYGSAVPTSLSFIRISRMDAGGIDEWFNTSLTLNPVLTDAGAAFTTSVDDFYLGDLRGGATAVPGFGTATSPSDFEISQIIVYNAALSDAQIAAINEWMVVPEPSAVLLLGLAVSMVSARRRRAG